MLGSPGLGGKTLKPGPHGAKFRSVDENVELDGVPGWMMEKGVCGLNSAERDEPLGRNHPATKILNPALLLPSFSGP